MIYSLIYSIFSRLGMLVITLLAVKWLNASDYGEFSYFINIINTFMLVGMAGCGVITNILFADKKLNHSQTLNEILGFNISLVSVLTFGIWLLFMCFYMFVTVSLPLFFIGFFSVIILISSNLNNLIENIYIGQADFRRLAINSFLIMFASMLFSGICIHIFGILGAFFSFLFYRIFSLLVNFKRVNYNFKNIPLSLKSKEGIAYFKKIGFPALLSSLMVAPVVSLLITVALSKTSFTEIGYFNWIYQWYLLAIFIPSALSGYFLQTLVKAEENKFKIFNRMISLALIFSAITIPIFLFLKPYVLIYAGEEYLVKANTLYIVMVISFVLYTINSIFSSLWVALIKAWVGVYLNVLWAIVMVFVGMVFIEKYGVDAIGYAFLSSYLTLFFIQYILYFIYQQRCKSEF